MADHEQRDPALTGVGDDARYGDPRQNPIAFIPVGETMFQPQSGPEPWDPGGTYLMPTVAGRVEYAGHLDYAHPTDAGTVGDVADHNDPTAPDPTPDEITDPDHPDHVEPWTG